MKESDCLYYESRDRANALIPKATKLRRAIDTSLNKLVIALRSDFNVTEEEVVEALSRVVIVMKAEQKFRGHLTRPKVGRKVRKKTF